jgi:pimeloyl-ACP methyl ester carboxylesterase
MLQFAITPILKIGYEESGPVDGVPAILLHGFPYDVRAYDEVARVLAGEGMRVVVPYLRGFGPTRFIDPSIPRSGQQGALAQDLIDLMDALGIDQAIIGGYDWGGRAATIVAAIAPERVIGLVTVDGYNMHDVSRSGEPDLPHEERSMWYQYYFQTERGRRGLERYREELCGLLWLDWSPQWADAAAAFELSKRSLQNPDFVDVVVHSYRVRHGLAGEDPRYAELEQIVAAQPPISVPSVILLPLADGLGVAEIASTVPLFVGGVEINELPGVGHNAPQEAPEAFVRAVLSLRGPVVG